MPIQASLTASDIKKKLEGYTVVKPNKLAELKPGDRVRYMIQNEFRGGGAVKVNKFPEYIVIINVVNKASWCMQLKDPTLKVWVKTAEKINTERDQMKKVFQLYNEGKLVKKK